MSHLHAVGKCLAIVFSLLFALLLFPEIVGKQGVFMSVVFTAAGIGCIWLFYFGLGSLFKHLYDAGRQAEGEDTSDFI